MNDLSQHPMSRVDSRLPVLLDRVATELHDLRRDLARYESAVLTRLEAAGHDVGPDLQSIDLSLQTLEEIACFVGNLSVLARGDTNPEDRPVRMAFKLEGVERRLLGLGPQTNTPSGPTEIDLF